MDTEERLMTAIDYMDTMSNRLRELSNLINTVYLGFLGENAEQQILDCTICFLHSVNELHKLTEQTMKEIHTRKTAPIEG